MVISDAKGTLLKECGHVLEQNGYAIKILNLHDLSKSMHYNPFQYIEREDDIEYLALCMAGSMADGKKRSAGTGDTYGKCNKDRDAIKAAHDIPMMEGGWHRGEK